MVARRDVQMTGLSEVIDPVEHQHERVVITRKGRAAAVLISPEDLEALEETLSVLRGGRWPSSCGSRWPSR
jgi:prevent-host-death family protein